MFKTNPSTKPRASAISILISITMCILAIPANDTVAAISTGIPRYDTAVTNGVRFLKGHVEKLTGGELSLAAYAMLKSGEDPESPAIVAAVNAVKAKVQNGAYRPTSSEHHIYEAGVDAMLVADQGDDESRPFLAAIAAYIISQQGGDGSWDYPDRTVGDTSMAQYAALGLWAAVRSEVEIPPRVWDMAARWHISTQKNDGGFQYHPGRNVSPATGGNDSTLNMAAGATGTLAICRMHLYPNERPYGQKGGSDSGEPKRLGILEKAGTDDPTAKKESNYKPQTPLGAFDSSVGRGLGWLNGRFRPLNDGQPFGAYYNYAVERTCSLNTVKELAGSDWFTTCGDALLTKQIDDGSFPYRNSAVNGTSFAILFYMRTTGRQIGIQYGSGILQAGRGLPDDFSEGFDPNKKPEPPKDLGPLDDLLKALESADLTDADAATKAAEAIVEKITVDPEELVGQQDRIRELAAHPHPDVQRTAVWALGRTGNMMMAPLLLDKLRNSYNVDVLIEVGRALCFVSRKPNGFGDPTSPLTGVDDGATDDDRTSAMEAWRTKMLNHWEPWWFSVRPYDQRGDIEELKLSRRLKQKSD